MAKISFGNTDIHKVSVGDQYNITKISIGNTIVYTAGNTVTYHVDTTEVHTEDVDAGESVLSPKSFTPTKTGYVFVGWRYDGTANGTTIDSLVMGNDPISLYAVFSKVITVTYYNGNTTKQIATGYQYYNNGTTVYPTFTITQNGISGWNAIGWSTSTAANGAISYKTLSGITITSDITLYAMYSATVYLYTVANGSTTTHSGVKYYNSGSGATINPTFTVANPSKSGWTFQGWSSAAGNATVTNATISNLSLNSTTYRYAVFKHSDVTGGGHAYVYLKKHTSSGTLYVNPDANAYSGHTITGKIYQWGFANGTTGYVTSNVYISGTLVASRQSLSSGSAYYTGSAPGNNEKVFTLTNKPGNVTYQYTGSIDSDILFEVTSVVWVGKTTVG